MDVEIAEERIFALTDRFTLDHAEGRAWSRRADAFGTVARLGGKVLEPRFLLDVGVEAVNIFVPGTQLVRIVVEHGAKQLAQPRNPEESALG